MIRLSTGSFPQVIRVYAGLSNTVLNLCHEYAGWMPKTFIKAGLKELPSVLEMPAGEFDTTTELVPPVLTWLSGVSRQGNPIDTHAGADTPISSR